MKAFLLAAGEGTRLRPLTIDTPKCLVPVCGRPLVEYWLDLFECYGINKVLMNTSYLADKVRNYMKKKSRGIEITFVHENKLLGSGGTIKNNWNFIENEESFFILYADNLTNINLKKMKNYHDKKGKDFTLALFSVPNPGECGIVTLDEASSVVSFVEKPENPVSNLAFAGIMLSNSRLKEAFPATDIFDLGYDVLPRIVGNASGYVIEDYLLDIGTPEKLFQAEHDVKNNALSKKNC